MYVNCDNEARSCNHCWSGKVISIRYSECVFVALVAQHEMRLRHIVNCGLPSSAVFFLHYLNNGAIKNLFVYKMCVMTFSTTFG
jgi:hypothetical protein